MSFPFDDFPRQTIALIFTCQRISFLFFFLSFSLDLFSHHLSPPALHFSAFSQRFISGEGWKKGKGKKAKALDDRVKLSRATDSGKMERLVAFARQIQSLFLSDIFFPFWPIFESLFHPFYYKIVKKYRERERERGFIPKIGRKDILQIFPTIASFSFPPPFPPEPRFRTGRDPVDLFLGGICF